MEDFFHNTVQGLIIIIPGPLQKISHELQKAQNSNFRCQRVFPLGTQLLSKCLLQYSLRQNNLWRFLFISRPF